MIDAKNESVRLSMGQCESLGNENVKRVKKGLINNKVIRLGFLKKEVIRQ